jgi:hypothetical protein
MFHNKLEVLQWAVVGPPSNPKAGGPPLGGCPQLLIQYICSYLHIWRPSPLPTTWGCVVPWWQDPLTWLLSVQFCNNFHRSYLGSRCVNNHFHETNVQWNVTDLTVRHQRDHWNNPPHPIASTDHKALQKRYSLTVPSVDSPKINLLPHSYKQAWKDIERLVHMCLWLCRMW